MTDDTLDITAVISSPAFKAAKPEVQKALLLKHFPDRYGAAEDTLGEDFSGVTGGASTTPVKSTYDTPLVPTTPSDVPLIPWIGGFGPNRSSPSPRDIVEQVPSAAAMAATAAFPEVGLPIRFGLAATGGAVGSMAKQGVESVISAPPSPPSIGEKYLLGATKENPASPAAKATLEGITQGVFEIPGSILKWAGGKFASRLPQKPEEKITEAVANELGLDLSNREIAPPLSRKGKILDTLANKGKSDVLSSFGPQDTMHNAGTTIYNATQTASKIAHDISSQNYAKLQGLTVNLQPHADTILSVPPSLLPPDLAAAVKGIAELRANNFPEAMVKKAETEAFGTVPFQTVQELRTAVREASDLPPGQALMANQNIGSLKLANKKLTDILDQAAIAGGKGEEWKAAREYHKTIGDLFERGLGAEVNRVGLTDPQRIVSLIQPNDIKAVRDMKAIFRYAEEGGNASDRLVARQAQRKFQRGFLDEKILDHPVEQWKTHIENAGRDVVAEVLGDPEAEKRLYGIATAAEQITPDSKLMSDAIAFAVMKSKALPASFGTTKNVLKDVTNYAALSTANTRKLVSALEAGAKSGPNYLRGVDILGNLLADMHKEAPPATPSQVR